MKKTFLVLLLALAGSALHAEVIALSTTSPLAGSYDVAVNLSQAFNGHTADDGLLGYGFDFSYDHAILSFAGETPGFYFTDHSGQAAPMVMGFADDYGFLSAGDFSEPLTLATLHFTRIGAGTTSLSVNAVATLTNNYGLIYLNQSDSFSTSTQIGTAATPEPSTILLGGSALLSLAFFKRRK